VLTNIFSQAILLNTKEALVGEKKFSEIVEETKLVLKAMDAGVEIPKMLILRDKLGHITVHYNRSELESWIEKKKRGSWWQRLKERLF